MKKYLDIKSGYIRNRKNGIELNWSIYEWAIPLHIDFQSDYCFFIRFFCVSLTIPTKFLHRNRALIYGFFLYTYLVAYSLYRLYYAV